MRSENAAGSGAQHTIYPGHTIKKKIFFFFCVIIYYVFSKNREVGIVYSVTHL